MMVPLMPISAGNVHGGTIMKLMEEAAGVAATVISPLSRRAANR
jgi:acyl-CoA hydrolase